MSFFPAFSNSLMESKCENRPKQYVAQMTSNHANLGQKPINSNLKQHRLKMSHFYLELFPYKHLYFADLIIYAEHGTN